MEKVCEGVFYKCKDCKVYFWVEDKGMLPECPICKGMLPECPICEEYAKGIRVVGKGSLIITDRG